MSSSQKYRAEKLAPLQERLVAFVQGKLDSEENAAGKAPLAQHRAPDITLDEVMAKSEGEISSLQKAATERDRRVAELDEVMVQSEDEISSLRNLPLSDAD